MRHVFYGGRHSGSFSIYFRWDVRSRIAGVITVRNFPVSKKNCDVLTVTTFYSTDQDGAEPCGNSIAVHNLIRLSVYLDRQDLRAKAGRVLTSFADRLKSMPVALPEMCSALLFYHDSPTQVRVVHTIENDNDTSSPRSSLRAGATTTRPRPSSTWCAPGFFPGE